MKSTKYPHFDTAMETNELKPKHFCEMCGIHINSASQLKDIAIMSEDGKSFLVRETLQACVNNNRFAKKSNITKILSKLKKKDIPLVEKQENAPIKKPIVKRKSVNKRRKIIFEIEVPDDEVEISEEYVKLWVRMIEKNLNGINELEFLEEIIKDAREDMKNVEATPYSKKASMKIIKDAYKMKEERKELISKNIVMIFVGASCDYILRGCKDIIVKELTEKGYDQQEINNVITRFVRLVNNANEVLSDFFDGWIK